MSRPVHHALFLSITAPFLLLVGGLLCPAANGASSEISAQPARFHRPGVSAIRETTQKILNDPQFAPRKTFWQIVWEWFSEKFKNTHFPQISGGLANILLWSLVIWSILAMLAILGHLIWTIVVLLRNRSGRASADWGSLTLLSSEQNMTYEELMARIREFSAQGDFRQAVALLMIALFKRLDSAGMIRFHESKTNGDYLREFPSDRPGRTELGQLALAFDETVYGGKSCDLQTYRQLYGIFERIQTYVG
jgi:hypothetical protein